jgi:hypothetical protein
MASSQQFLFAPDKPPIKQLVMATDWEKLNDFAARQNTRRDDLSQIGRL